MVIQDLDDPAGYGAFWGEVQSNVHKALGCHGVVTNGCVRDIPTIAAGFQMLAGSIAPSHAFVHVVDFGGEVTVHGMAVKSGDLIHADRHGAVVVPIDKISAMRGALDSLTKTEARIIEAARASGATVERIKAAIRGLPVWLRGIYNPGALLGRIRGALSTALTMSTCNKDAAPLSRTTAI
jgi:regulator of RNase E activity RraA